MKGQEEKEDDDDEMDLFISELRGMAVCISVASESLGVRNGVLKDVRFY